jgi:hypothetical protein
MLISNRPVSLAHQYSIVEYSEVISRTTGPNFKTIDRTLQDFVVLLSFRDADNPSLQDLRVHPQLYPARSSNRQFFGIMDAL